jgi:hypothetical protein
MLKSVLCLQYPMLLTGALIANEFHEQTAMHPRASAVQMAKTCDVIR